MRIAMIGARGVVVGERGGGVERHVAELARRMALEHEVTVFCRARRGEERPPRWEGVRLRYVPTIFAKHLETLVHTKLSLFAAMREGFDVIHLHGIGPGALAWLPRLLSRATVVVTLHGQDQYHGKWGFMARWLLTFAERVAVRAPHYAIAVSHVIQVYCRKKFGVETVYIPNGVAAPSEVGLEALRPFGLTESRYVLAVARLVPQKGLHELLEAYREVQSDFALVVAGSSSYTDAYVRQLQELAAQDARVRLVGYQEGDALAALYRFAYVFVHPSHAEGLSVAVLEAMSYGLAPLVADIPANREAIAGHGLTFPAGDVAALRARLQAMLAAPEEVRRAGEAAREYVVTQCTWDAAAERTLGVYRTARH